MKATRREATSHTPETNFDRPREMKQTQVWLRMKHYVWLDQQVLFRRGLAITKPGSPTNINRGTIIRELIDAAIEEDERGH